MRHVKRKHQEIGCNIVYCVLLILEALYYWCEIEKKILTSKCYLLNVTLHGSEAKPQRSETLYFHGKIEKAIIQELLESLTFIKCKFFSNEIG